jgi:plastocyanin
MKRIPLHTLLYLAALSGALSGAEITGLVQIPQSVSKLDTPAYSRGVMIPKLPDQAERKQTDEGPKIIVWAEPEAGEATFVLPKEKLEVKQQNKAFVPDLLAIQVGTTVGFPNLDPLYHNVFSYSKAKRFDLGRYSRGKSKDITFDEVGVVEVFCEIHENMHAFIIVVDTPYFTRSGKNGRFTLTVPDGRYRVFAWYPNRTSEPVRADLTEAETVEIEFSF